MSRDLCIDEGNQLIPCLCNHYTIFSSFPLYIIENFVHAFDTKKALVTPINPQSPIMRVKLFTTLTESILTSHTYFPWADAYASTPNPIDAKNSDRTNKTFFFLLPCFGTMFSQTPLP